MDDADKDIDNISTNYVLRFKQIQRFLPQFLKFPFQINWISEMEDINPHILKILYDLTTKSFQIGSLCKDLKKAPTQEFKNNKSTMKSSPKSFLR